MMFKKRDVQLSLLEWFKRVETGLRRPCKLWKGVPLSIRYCFRRNSRDLLCYIELIELASIEFQRKVPFKEEICLVLFVFERLQAWLSQREVFYKSNFSIYGGPEAVVRLLFCLRESHNERKSLKDTSVDISCTQSLEQAATDDCEVSTSDLSSANFSLAHLDNLRRVFEGLESVIDAFLGEYVIRYATLNLYDSFKELETSALFLLKMCCLSIPGVVERLSLRKDLLIYLFTLTSNKDRTSIYAVGILDELLAVRRETFPLVEVPHLYSLLCDLSPAELAYVSRVLALLVFEPMQCQISEYPRIKSLTEYLASRTPSVINSMKIVEENNSILLGCSLLIRRLIVVAACPFQHCDISWSQECSSFVSTEWLNSSLEKETDGEWRQFLISLIEYHLALKEHMEHTSEDCSQDDMYIDKASTRIDDLFMHLSSRTRAVFDIVGKNKRELLFVICSLLSGERQVEAQDIFFSEGLFSALLFLFSGMDWSSAPPQSHSGLHGPNCECNPKNAEKIQLLRLLQNFVQREDDNRKLKRQLLSSRERMAIRNYSSRPPPRSTRRRRSFLLSSEGEQGFARDSSSSSIHETFFLSSSFFTSNDIGGPLHRSYSTDTTSDVCQTLANTFLGQDGMEGAEDIGVGSRSISELVHIGRSSSKYEISAYKGEGRLILHDDTDWDDAESVVTDVEDNPSVLSDEELPKEKGMISLLIDIFTNRVMDSSCFVSLASCLESFLEGATNAEQALLARRGLLHSLVLQIINHDGTVFDCSNTLQASFDLLSQLCQFNRDIFFALNLELKSEEGEKAMRFFRNLSRNLVDSNFFLRSVVLSLHRFRMEDELAVSFSARSSGTAAFAPYNFSNCVLLHFVQKNRVRLVHDLIHAVRDGEVNQENISCITTAILFFLISDVNMELDSFLTKIRLWEAAADPKSYRRTMRNLRGLVSFWYEYYAVRSVAVLHLERSSFIPFSEWKRIVDLLLEAL
ncbi:TRPChannel associate protein [Galdieria sulphuraria]|uniref:TRPChannel associate protein n=1 Tax=Galdieria sulphuraria TaxID=130081 RepID=M2X4B7_GALSU|nr:TRPChannel associate protein [Galdieria sulphuraria]EME31275.1 TRPChannel associate protein [Galdieria sulphuraria]|eukprot:XP_005707795.1 TRPChannel associate protein [Galdieria sulphuraria]